MTLESLKLWFQDWSDACEYAKECGPDVGVFAPDEPYSALISIAVACFLAWWWNERKGNGHAWLRTSEGPELARSPKGGETRAPLTWKKPAHLSYGEHDAAQTWRVSDSEHSPLG